MGKKGGSVERTEEPQPTSPGEEDDALAGELPHAEPDPMDVERADPQAELKEKLARARADYQNLQARTERDAAAERERVRARVLEGFLQVYEYGRMAVAEAEKTPGPLAEGIKMVVKEFDRLLEGEGVKMIDATGPFDAAVHEAVAEEVVEGVAPGAVARVVTPGYRLGERVLRHARVVVGAEPPA